MELFKISNLTRFYQNGNKEKQYVLKNISFSLPASGLVCVLGASGSGKSTLLNLLSLLDKPNSGKIYYQDKDINKFNDKKKNNYLNQEIGFIYQQYNLIEEETALYNIMLPLLIKGEKEEVARKVAEKLFLTIDLNPELMNTPCALLSGGEKQRVAILRAIINTPKVLFADEPTGALDSLNSIKIMDLLKNISKDKLVIVVSHNIDLLNKYADRIIQIEKGKISKDIVINNNSHPVFTKNKYRPRKHHDYISHIYKNNLKRRKRRNIFAVSAFSISLIFTMLITGFINNAKNSIKNACFKQLDYSVGIIQKEIKSVSNDQGIGLVRTLRPSKEDVSKIINSFDDFLICNNYDALLSNLDIGIANSKIEGITYNPIYSFDYQFLYKTLLIKGTLPQSDVLNEVIINESAYKHLKDVLNYEPLNSVLDISIIYNHNSYIDAEIISDSLKINFNFKIAAVVKELDFLNTPKIYYSYLAFEQLLEETPLENLSKYKDTFVSWKDVVENSLDTENISSYSYRIFLKDINKIQTLDSFIKTLEPSLIVTFSGLLIRDALLDIVSALDIGMILFLLLTSLGSVLILGILAFSNYMDDRKRNAILMGMGMDKNSIIDIHLNESVFVAVISVLISLFLSFFLSHPINMLISHLTGYKNMIIIPFSRLFHIPFLFPVLILVLSLMVALFITVIPILFAKKISIKEKLKSDD